MVSEGVRDTVGEAPDDDAPIKEGDRGSGSDHEREVALYIDPRNDVIQQNLRKGFRRCVEGKDLHDDPVYQQHRIVVEGLARRERVWDAEREACCA